jgi:hypothetical protein
MNCATMCSVASIAWTMEISRARKADGALGLSAKNVPEDH